MLTRGAPVGTYRLVWSGDSAIKPIEYPPDAPEGDADAAAARKIAVAALEAKRENDWRVACETGQWAPLLVPGEKPTYFVFRTLGYSAFKAWDDAKRTNGGRMGLSMTYRRLVQLALVAVENFGETIDTTPALDPDIGEKRVSDAAIDQIVAGMSRARADALVIELAHGVFQHEEKTDPKS